jgi:RNA polymerase sigma-B factor
VKDNVSRPRAGQPLDAEERVDTILVRRFRAGDAAAGEELVRRLTPMVERLARAYPGHEHADDMRQAAFLGLAKAIGRFDPDLGIPLRAYAGPTITGELLRYRRDHGWAVRPPRGLQERVLRVHRSVDRLTRATGRRPTPTQLAADLEESEQAVVEALIAGRAYLAASLDAPLPRTDDDAGQTLGEALASSEEGYERVHEADLMDALMLVLPEEDRVVLRLRFVADWSQQRIADRFGVSQMTISRREHRALELLRVHLATDARLRDGLAVAIGDGAQALPTFVVPNMRVRRPTS